MEREIKGWQRHSDVYEPSVMENVYSMKKVGIPRLDKLAAKYDLMSYIASVRDDQGDLGLCFAFAGAGILEYNLKNIAPLGIWEELSEMFLGYYSRYILNNNTKPTGDDGSTILATMQAMHTYGICLAKTWAYVDSKENVTPSAAAIKEAQQFEVGLYFSIPQTQDTAKINAIKSSIYAGVPIMYGSDVHNSIMNVGSNGIEPYAKPTSTTDPIAGGHARYIIGWDDSKVIKGISTPGAFLVMNSWGASWGSNGTSWVSYQVWIDQETDDMGITSQIAPVPTPVPPTPVPPITPSNALADAKAVVTAAQKVVADLS